VTKPHYRLTTSGEVLPAIKVTDGFRNLVANLGTPRDKSYGNSWDTTTMTDLEATNAYRNSAVARIVVDAMAEDSCREWRAWQADKDQISKLEAEEKRLGLVQKVMSARKRARLYGGAAIYIGTGDTNLEMPLNTRSVKAGGLRYLTLLDRRQLNASDMQDDPTQPGYGIPMFYEVSGATTGSVRIHPTRLAVFRGDELPDNDLARSNHGWGESVLQSTLEKVGHLDATVANIASLVFEAKVDVVKIKDFTAGLRDGGSAYERLMLQRLTLAMTAKGINGALLMDADEDYQQKSANFSTLPDIMDRMMQMVSAAAEIPMTRLFGMSPSGLNATGDADMRNYYDRVRQHQTLEMEPTMSNLDECLIRSALGDRPEEVHYNWRSLWQMTEAEKVDIAGKIVTAAQGMQLGEFASHEAIGAAATNALIESGAFPGLEAAIEEFPGVDDGPEDDETDPLTGDPVGVGDAAPRTLYVHRKVVNADDIIAWAKAQGFGTTLPADDLHVTIAFSRQPVDWMKVGDAWESEVKVAAGGPRLMERFGDARVLLFSSSHLSWRHEDIKRAGASWDHPEYQPHITISYAEDAPDLTSVEPYTGEIVLGPEVFSEVKDDWQKGVTEE
jgi:uncharacterized protein